MNYPNVPIDIVLLSCNRIDNTKETIKQLYDRVRCPEMIRLIVVDNESIDGTREYLEEEKKNGRIHFLETCPADKPITIAYNIGFRKVQSELFIMMQDDITIAKLEPKDVIEQLIDLMIKYPGQAGIGCRIQRIPNLLTHEGNEDLIPSRKSLSAYFRIQYRSDYEKMGMLDETKSWDDRDFHGRVHEVLKKDCSWARNLWADHTRGYCIDRGYKVKPRKWGMGIHHRLKQEIERKPYPKIDSLTNVPLPGEKMYR